MSHFRRKSTSPSSPKPVGGDRFFPAVWCLVFSLLAGICFWHGIGGSAIPERLSSPSLADHEEPRTAEAARLDAPVTTKSIQDVRVGMRTAGKNPLRYQVDPDASEPDPETWRHLVLRMTKDCGGRLDINLLRQPPWIEAVGAVEGDSFYLELAEMGAVGDAFVESIGPCPPIEPGPGNVVTGTFHHEAYPGQKILRVDFTNGAVIDGVTANHPFYSVDRRDFVAIGDMRPGDFVKVSDGITTIKNIEYRSAQPGEILYNLEVQDEHVYHVTSSGILVHNVCILDFARLRRARQLADDIARNRIFRMREDELALVNRIRREKENIQIYRTNQKALLGDFLLIDRSNPKRPIAFLVDLKSGGGRARNQLSNWRAVSQVFHIDEKLVFRLSGTADQLMRTLSRGRAAFPQ